MNRRRFLLTSIAGALAQPLAVRAQQAAKVARVGFFTLYPSAPGNAALTLDVFRQGLRELGYNEGTNLTLENRFAEGGREIIPALARELVTLPVDVIVTLGTPAPVAAREATSSVPIVFIKVGDPVGVRILTGAKPAALAIEQPTKFELVINLKDRQSPRPDGSAVAAGAGGSGHRAVIA